MLSTLMDHVKSVCVLPACCNFCAESFGGKILRSREGHQALRWRHRSGPMLLRRGSFQGPLELRRARPWRTLAQRFPWIWRLRRLCSSRYCASTRARRVPSCERRSPLSCAGNIYAFGKDVIRQMPCRRMVRSQRLLRSSTSPIVCLIAPARHSRCRVSLSSVHQRLRRNHSAGSSHPWRRHISW
jgi:hypothetical protein